MGKRARHIWTREECCSLAKKYKCSSDFKKIEPRAYKAAQKYGWLKDYVWFIPHYHAIKWTYETCWDEAKKYKTKVEFQQGSSGAFKYAYNNGIIKDFDWFEELKKPNGYWTTPS